MAALPDVASTALDLPAVADLDALVDKVAGHVEPGSVVVGHPLGGVVVMHLAERHPSVLAGLVLVTAPVGAEDPESARARAYRAVGLSAEAYEEIALDGMEAVYHGERGHDPQIRAERLRAARVYGPERLPPTRSQSERGEIAGSCPRRRPARCPSWAPRMTRWFPPRSSAGGRRRTRRRT